MNLVVDASVLVGEVLRSRGLALLGHPGLMLFQPEHAAGETAHELRRRTDRMAHSGRTTPQRASALLENALHFAASNVMVLGHGDYSPREAEARRRIPRDPNDWPLVALALHLGEVPILTTDGDFLGCGLPTWTPDTLRAHLGL